MPGIAAYPLQVALAVVVIAVLTGLTAFALTKCLKQRSDPDSLFWYGFIGIFTVIVAVVASAAILPGSGILVGPAALLFSAVAASWIWRGEQAREARRRRAATQEMHAALHRRHESVLQEWVSYEIDPARAIDFPSMSDAGRPETSALIRAMRKAAVAREQLESNDAVAPAYESAVRNLEAAFHTAEIAVGARPAAMKPLAER